MTNAIVQALEGGAKKLGKALTDDTGKAVHGLYSDTANGAKKVVENTTKTDAEHATHLTKILDDGKHDTVKDPKVPGQGGEHPGGEGGGHPGGGDGGGHPGGEGGSGSSPQPKGVKLDPQPDWHGKTAGDMKGHRGPALSVTGLDSEARKTVLRDESATLADAARAPRNTKVAPGPGEYRVTTGCAGSFEHGDTITSHTSTKKNGLQEKPTTHPMVAKVLDEIEQDQKAGKIDPLGAGHGKCAEVSLLSDRLHQLDPDGTKITTVEEAKAALSGGNMHTRQIGDSRGPGEKHGEYKPPCGTCTHLLPRLGVNPIK
ncbi:YwqJ-related putative deaminase [Kitasatospora sp. GAS1066B]|uniref:YwqJ-related putative deaminase n=1 Tax=Kitasatospora sp. GAS1066B TaxID=3156271 RepID=UPI00351891B2